MHLSVYFLGPNYCVSFSSLLITYINSRIQPALFSLVRVVLSIFFSRQYLPLSFSNSMYPASAEWSSSFNLSWFYRTVSFLLLFLIRVRSIRMFVLSKRIDPKATILNKLEICSRPMMCAEMLNEYRSSISGDQ
jgi:hypothetical protein